MNFGLLGYPLGHSFSAKYFAEKFSASQYRGWTYRNFERSDLDAFFRDEAPLLDGFNVTIPYKRDVMPYLRDISPEAAAIGAVNCVKNTAGELVGYNTDAMGFGISLEQFLDGYIPSYALVLGSGGASKAVGYVLGRMGITFEIVSRSGELNYRNVNSRLKEARLIVNTTPLGTFPNVLGKPDLNYRLLSPDCRLYDLVYNPATTAFMEEGMKAGCKVTSGLRMLHLQADKSLEIWTSLKST